MVQLSYLWWGIGCCARREARQDRFSSAGPDRLADELFDVVLRLGERYTAAKSDRSGGEGGGRFNERAGGWSRCAVCIED